MSCKCERTFRPITALQEMEGKISELAAHLADDMAREDLKGRSLTLKLKGTDFKVGRSPFLTLQRLRALPGASSCSGRRSGRGARRP